MPDYRDVYTHHADRYDTLVSHEDHQGNLARMLDALALAPALNVVETGAGTGRVTRLLAPRARSIAAFDASPAMIAVAQPTLRQQPHVRFGVATHDALPVADACADLAVEAWAFGHALGWNPTAWSDDIVRWVLELERTVRPGGLILLIETMGTGVETPFAGGHSLQPFHTLVTETLGFAHHTIRTDYAFTNVDEAAETLGFFFGDRMASRVRERQWTHVPECTGVYTRRRS
jgi:ubiquinone/menaquinone biosynthesis C-methylase UbiE